jgi:hypothetical protein
MPYFEWFVNAIEDPIPVGYVASSTFASHRGGELTEVICLICTDFGVPRHSRPTPLASRTVVSVPYPTHHPTHLSHPVSAHTIKRRSQTVFTDTTNHTRITLDRADPIKAVSTTTANAACSFQAVPPGFPSPLLPPFYESQYQALVRNPARATSVPLPTARRGTSRASSFSLSTAVLGGLADQHGTARPQPGRSVSSRTPLRRNAQFDPNLMDSLSFTVATWLDASSSRDQLID